MGREIEETVDDGSRSGGEPKGERNGALCNDLWRTARGGIIESAPASWPIPSGSTGEGRQKV